MQQADKLEQQQQGKRTIKIIVVYLLSGAASFDLCSSSMRVGSVRFDL